MRSPVWRGAVGSLVALTLVACGGKHNVHLAPQPDVEMDPHVLAKFTEEVREYVHLRRKIVGTLPPAGSESTPEEIFERQHSMKVAIQEARRGAERGDFFKKSVEAAMRRIIQTEMQGPDKASMVREIQQGNPPTTWTSPSWTGWRPSSASRARSGRSVSSTIRSTPRLAPTAPHWICARSWSPSSRTTA